MKFQPTSEDMKRDLAEHLGLFQTICATLAAGHLPPECHLLELARAAPAALAGLRRALTAELDLAEMRAGQEAVFRLHEAEVRDLRGEILSLRERVREQAAALSRLSGRKE